MLSNSLIQTLSTIKNRGYPTDWLALLSIIGLTGISILLFIFPEVSVPLGGGDASNIINRTLRLVTTGEIPPRDPPLRYIVFALGEMIGIRSPAQNMYAMTSFLGLPILAISLWAYSFLSFGQRAAATTVILFLIGAGMGLIRLPWYDNWMYITPLPFVVVALVAVQESLKSDRVSVAVIAGILTAIVGLQQILLAGMVVLIAVLSYLRTHSVQDLISYSLAGLPAIIVLFQWDYFEAQNSVSSNKLELAEIGPGRLISITQLDLSGMFHPPFSVIVIAAVIYFGTQIKDRSTVVSSSVVGILPLMIISHIMLLRPWVSSLSAIFLQLTLTIGIARVVETRLPPIKTQRTFVLCCVSLSAAGLAILHLLVQTPGM